MIIQPRILKGFRDSLPEEEIFRKKIIAELEKLFESFGFVPIDTPVLEYTEVLLGKGGGETDKQVYSFTDHGKRDVSMRFDLTVPFARFMGAHANELYLPFKRYHISKVWRGENTQRGRFREFFQCDFDIVGTDSENADIEILQLIYSSFKALDIGNIEIHINNRGLFNSLLAKLKLSDKYLDILRIVDKLGKIGREETEKLLTETCGSEGTSKIIEFITCGGSFADSLEKISGLVDADDPAIERMRTIFNVLERIIPEESLVFDPSIARGLDYYTGIVYETFLKDNMEIGSVCSGGRYDNLASLYTKMNLPGVGAAIGLDRLITVLQENGNITAYASAEAVIFNMDEKYVSEYFALAAKLRESGISAEIFYEKKKISQQFGYAEKKAITFAVICGEDEFGKGLFSLKNLATRESWNMIKYEDMTEHIKSARIKRDS